MTTYTIYFQRAASNGLHTHPWYYYLQQTPWCLLSFWHGWILLAAFGAVGLFQMATARYVRLSIILLLTIGTLQIIYLSFQTHFRYSVDSQNPYVYAHPLQDVLLMAEQVDQFSQVHSLGGRYAYRCYLP